MAKGKKKTQSKKTILKTKLKLKSTKKSKPNLQKSLKTIKPVSSSQSGNWLDRLKRDFKGDIATDDATLEVHSRDASIFHVKPEVVVFPKNQEDINFLVNFVNNEKSQKLSLTARAAGTDMTGGPLSKSIVISFTKYLNHLKKLESDYATVEPGLYYHDFEKEMDKIDVMYPSYPASKSICAMGGIIANNSGGEKTLTYGQTLNHVTRIKAVFADGNTYELRKLNRKELDAKMKQKNFEGKIYRDIFNICEKNYDIIKAAAPQVNKNSTGYFLWRVWDRDTQEFDLTKLFCGSQGTLGIWLEADVNLVKKHKYSRLVSITLQDLKQMTHAVNTVLPYKPESLESFDKNTLMLGIKFMPEIAKKVNQNLISFLWGFRREAVQALFKGFPVFIILVEITGDSEEEIHQRIDAVCADLKKQKIPHLAMKTEKDGMKYWIMRRESFALLRSKVKDKMATPFVDDFCVKPEYLPEFLPQLYSMLKEHGITPTLAGHSGDGNFHIIPLMDLKKKEERDKIPIVLEKFTDLVLKYHGTIAAEHNDGMIRSSFVEKQYGKDIVKLFEQVKDTFDPKGIFNPGKKVRADFEFAMAHVKEK